MGIKVKSRGSLCASAEGVVWVVGGSCHGGGGRRVGGLFGQRVLLGVEDGRVMVVECRLQRAGGATKLQVRPLRGVGVPCHKVVKAQRREMVARRVGRHGIGCRRKPRGTHTGLGELKVQRHKRVLHVGSVARLRRRGGWPERIKDAVGADLGVGSG